MNELNRLSILCRVGDDPDDTTLRDGSVRAAFSVAPSNCNRARSCGMNSGPQDHRTF